MAASRHDPKILPPFRASCESQMPWAQIRLEFLPRRGRAFLMGVEPSAFCPEHLQIFRTSVLPYFLCKQMQGRFSLTRVRGTAPQFIVGMSGARLLAVLRRKLALFAESVTGIDAIGVVVVNCRNNHEVSA